jgi:hypothetical protein
LAVMLWILSFVSLFIWRNTQILNFMKIRPVGAELNADRRTIERTDMTTLTVAFRNTANAPNKMHI